MKNININYKVINLKVMELGLYKFGYYSYAALQCIAMIASDAGYCYTRRVVYLCLLVTRVSPAKKLS